jgi:hypothetical protein
VPEDATKNQSAYVSGVLTYNALTGNLVTGGTISATNIAPSANVAANASVSGTNTGDQDLSGYALKASPSLTGTVSTQNLTVTSQGNGTSYALSLANGTYRWDNKLNSSNSLTWTPYNVGSSEGTKMTLSAGGDLTIPGSYYGDGSHLTGISAPVTSVNGQTGAVTISAGVTSVNGQTGGVTVDKLYNGRTGLYAPIANIVYNPSAYGGWYSGYVGDYWSSSGFSLTGLTTTNFSSWYNGGSQWVVSFTLEFRQAFCDAYLSVLTPGASYKPEDIRMVNVSMNTPSNYGVSWVGKPNTAHWNTSSGGAVTITYAMTPNLSEMVAKVNISFVSDDNETTDANNRASPTVWPYHLFLRVWVAN